MTWGTPRSYGRNIDVGLECLGARLVPTVGMTWGTPRSYGRNDLGHAYGRNIDVGQVNALGHASFLR